MEDSENLFEKYYEDVFRFLRGLTLDQHLADELTQETFYRALKSIDTYRGESEWRVWLCSIAKNLYFTYYKKQKRLVPMDDCNEFLPDEKHFTEIIADREMALNLHRLLHDLRDPYKEIFSLRVFGELSFKEIATLFGKSEHWACVTYHRAKEMIISKMRGESL